MKKNYFMLLATMATAAICLPSCNNEETPEIVNSPKELKITASFNPTIDITTRANSSLQSTTPVDFTNIGIYVWYTGATEAVNSPVTYNGYANDQVASSTGSTSPYTLTPTTTPMYFPVDNADVDVYLYAPYKAISAQTNMVMEHTVAADQSLTAGYLASDFIYGKATAKYTGAVSPEENKTARVTMYHAMSKIIFKVVNNGVSPTNMTNISIKNVNTKTTINMPQAIGASLTCGSNTTDNVGVSSVSGDILVWQPSSDPAAVPVADTQTSGVAAILPPQTTGGSAVISVTVDGKVATAAFDNVTLAPGMAYTYNLKLIGQTLTIKLVGITDWGDGGTDNLDFDTWNTPNP